MAWRGVIRRRACAPLLLLIVVVPSRPRSPTAAEPQVSGRRYTGWWGRFFFLVEKAGGGIWSSSSSSEEDENTDLPAWVSGDDSTGIAVSMDLPVMLAGDRVLVAVPVPAPSSSSLSEDKDQDNEAPPYWTILRIWPLVLLLVGEDAANEEGDAGGVYGIVVNERASTTSRFRECEHRPCSENKKTWRSYRTAIVIEKGSALGRWENMAVLCCVSQRSMAC